MDCSYITNRFVERKLSALACAIHTLCRQAYTNTGTLITRALENKNMVHLDLWEVLSKQESF